MLDARGAQAGEAVLVDRILPGQEFFDGQGIAGAGFLEGQQSATDCCNHTALRRMTQRFVVGGGRSAMVSGLPSGPMTYLTLGRWGSVIGILTKTLLMTATLEKTTGPDLKFA